MELVIFKNVSRICMFACAGFIFFSSCQIDPIIFRAKDFEPKLELKCIFYQGDTIRFTLTRSVFSPFGLDEELIYIDGANADLFEDGEYVGSFYQVPCNGCENYTYDGYYKIDYLPISGSSYRIEVEAEGYDEIHAETKIPSIGVNISELSIARQYFSVHPNEYYYDLIAELEDKNDTNNYYLINIDFERILASSINGDTLQRRVLTKRFIFPQKYLINNIDAFSGEYYRSVVFSDDYFENSTIRLYLNELEVSTIDDEDCNTQDVECKRLFKIYSGNIPKELYDFIYSSALQDMNYKDPFAEPVNIDGNIENGHGIFAGYNRSVFPIFIDIP